MTVLAVDPGNTKSAYCLLEPATCQPRVFGKVRNDELLHLLPNFKADLVVLEMVASYGMAVGADVFETCVWTGRFFQALAAKGPEPQLVKRLPVKLHHCMSARATDSNVRQALVDRFASGEPNHGKGSKAQPGWFHGFAADVWAAYALAVFAADTMHVKAGAAA